MDATTEALTTYTAGALSFTLDPEGALAEIRCNGFEVIRRIAVVVRDRNWNTVAGRISDLSVDSDSDSDSDRDSDRDSDQSAVRFSSRHVSQEVDFTWHGRIDGTSSGRIDFSMTGVSNRDFLRNRIGLVVLHPAATCATRPVTIHHSDGSTQRTRFPELVSAHQVATDIAGMEYWVHDNAGVALTFAGEVFEMEDQRNWSDASYKTYGTPLATPFPVSVLAGTRVDQSVVITSLVPQHLQELPESGPLTFTVRERSGRTFPAVGLGINAALSARLCELPVDARLLAASPSHIRVDVDPRIPEQLETLRSAGMLAAGLSAGLEVAVHLQQPAKPTERERDVDRIASLVPELAVPVTSWLVFADGTPATPSEAFTAFRTRMLATTPTAQFAAGTDAYLAELNRNSVPAASLDLACFSLNPQVHDVRESAILQTVEVLDAMVATARRGWPVRGVAVTPVTLKPRFNPNATGAELDPQPGEPPADTDPRQSTLFAATWVAATMGALARAGVTTTTWMEHIGPRGLMPDRDDTATPQTDSVYPLFHVLADAMQLRGAEVLVSHASAPQLVDGIVVERDGRRHAIIWNASESTQKVRVTGFNSPMRVRALDYATLDRATTQWSRYRDELEDVVTEGDAVDLVLAGYAILKVESHE